MKPPRVPFALVMVAAALITGCTAAEVGPSLPGGLEPGQSTAPTQATPPTSAPGTSSATTAGTPAEPKPTTTTIVASPYDEVPQPTNDGWQTASLADVGIDPGPIGEMLAEIYHGDRPGFHHWPPGQEKYENIHGILIVKDGRLVFEEYFYGYRLDSRHNVASVTKSIASLLVGIAIERGDIGGVDQQALPFFPEYLPLERPDERFEGITIEDLLTMRHGWECDDWDPDSATYYLDDWEGSQPDLVTATLNLPPATAPGSHFSYCSASTVVLGGLITKATGMGVPEYADEVLFAPLGIETALWSRASGGWTDTGGSLQMRPRDMARVGLLLLQDGDWGAAQVVPAEWVHQSVQEHVRLSFNETWGRGYGYLWWLSEVPVAGRVVRSFAASGAGGQVIAVFPDLEMVVVITGGNYDDDEGQPFEIMERFILPAVMGA